MWGRNVVGRDRRKCFACWLSKGTDTHSEYRKLTPFPQQQWFDERALVLRYPHFACLVTFQNLVSFFLDHIYNNNNYYYFYYYPRKIVLPTSGFLITKMT
jgi:hypothetical protein